MYNTHLYKNVIHTMEDILDRSIFGLDCINTTCDYKVFEEGDVIKLQTPLPGRVKEDLSIKIKQSVLSIEVKGSDKNHWSKNDIKLQWKINESIKADKTKASLENGILTVTLHKKNSDEFDVNLF